MNPNPEQPDAPFSVHRAGLVVQNCRRDVVALLPKQQYANLICAALNAAPALHAAGYDAARVFARLPEVMRVLAGYIDEHETQEAAVFLAQLKLKRDTAGGGR